MSLKSKKQAAKLLEHLSAIKRGHPKTGKELNISEKQRHLPSAASGAFGCSKGGKVRAKRLSPEMKREIASLGGRARWANKNKTGQSASGLLPSSQ